MDLAGPGRQPLPARRTIRVRTPKPVWLGGMNSSHVIEGAQAMSTGKLSHLQVNVKQENLPFYRELFTLLGWQPHYSDASFDAFNSQGHVSVWFMAGANDAPNNPDGPGVNHIGIAAESQAAVDATVAFLGEHGVESLF